MEDREIKKIKLSGKIELLKDITELAYISKSYDIAIKYFSKQIREEFEELEEFEKFERKYNK